MFENGNFRRRKRMKRTYRPANYSRVHESYVPNPNTYVNARAVFPHNSYQSYPRYEAQYVKHKLVACTICLNTHRLCFDIRMIISNWFIILLWSFRQTSWHLINAQYAPDSSFCLRPAKRIKLRSILNGNRFIAGYCRWNILHEFKPEPLH